MYYSRIKEAEQEADHFHYNGQEEITNTKDKLKNLGTCIMSFPLRNNLSGTGRLVPTLRSVFRTYLSKF